MSVVNVLRYSALGLGFLSGVQVEWCLKKEENKAKELEDYNRKLKLIEDAKKEYAKLHPVQKIEPVGKVDNLDNVNLDDPNTDFNTLIESWVGKLSN